jgi:parallel beta-helix repeat protein
MAIPTSRKRFQFTLLLIILLTLSTFSFTLQADISHPSGSEGTRGDIFWNETTLTNDYTVPSGTTLHVLPGAIVVFEGPHSIFVEGALLALGEENNTIQFTSGADYKQPGDWGSIRFNSTSGSSSVLSHVIIEYAEIGVECQDSSPTLSNVTLMYNLYAGIFATGSDSTIENSNLTKNRGHGIHAVNSSLLIENNSVDNNSADGVFAIANSSITLKDNLVAFNDYDGVHLAGDSYATFVNNSISSNGHNGIYISDESDALISKNLIANNAWHGIKTVESIAEMDNNTITHNGGLPWKGGVYAFESEVNLYWNYIALNGGDGVRFQKSTGIVANNQIISNDAGIALEWSRNPNITKNRIMDNVCGIYMENSTPMIRENVLMNNRFGIHSTDSPDVAVEMNTITNALGKDIMVGDGEGDLIHYYSKGGTLYAVLDAVRTTDQRKVNVGADAVPSSADLDGDGRPDLIIGNREGFFHYFRNTGDGFQDMGLLTDETPITDLNVGSYAHPFVTDWDFDGDLDLLIGRGDGNISYFTNDGDDVFENQGLLMEDEKNLDVGGRAAPLFIDWKGQVEVRDLVVGNDQGNVSHYLRLGGEGRTNFTLSEKLQWVEGIELHPISGQGLNIVPWLVDWDVDGDSRRDLITGNDTGIYFWNRNVGDYFDYAICIINFTEEMNARAVDWDNNGVDDLIVGGATGSVYYYGRVVGDNTFEAPVPFGSDSGNIKLGDWSSPFPVHWDDDGVLDLVVGDGDGYLTLFLGRTPGNVTLQSGQRLQTKGLPNEITTGSWSAPAVVDWNDDGDLDLIAGGQGGKISYYENNGKNEFVFRWNLSSQGSELLVGQQSVPHIVDWDANGTLDILVGDSEGYVLRFERIPNDPRNLTNLSYLDADGSDINVGQRSIPCSGDLDEDGDLDLLVGDDQGKVHYFERQGDQLFYRNYLRDDTSNLNVQNFSAPLVLGWEFSSNDKTTGNGMFFENSSARIFDNDVIRGGGEGYAIYASNSSIVLENIGWVGGGKGLLEGGSGDKASSGGPGIVAQHSTVQIADTRVYGGDGSDTSRERYEEGGDGGVGIDMKGGALRILNSSVGGGTGRMGIVTRGTDGVGISLRDIPDVFVDSSGLRGRTALLLSNASIYIRNGFVSSGALNIDLGNASSATLMNTSFERDRALFRDSFSSLRVGWHLNVLVLDNSSNPLPRTEITAWPATFTNRGQIYLNPTISGPASPAVANLTMVDSVDLVVGDAGGRVQHFLWNGLGFEYQGTLNKSGSVPISVAGHCSPYLADWNNDGNLDLFLGDANGSIWSFTNLGGGTFEDGNPLTLFNGTNITISGEAVPRIVDWNGNGTLDLVAGGDGFITFYENVGNNTFHPGVRIKANGYDIMHGSWSSVWPEDFDEDGLIDLLVGDLDGRVALYLNDGRNNTRFGGYLKTNNSILHNIDVGHNSTVAVADVTGDGYPDLLIGNSDGQVLSYESNRNAANVTSYTELDGYALETPVLEYEQRDTNGDTDGEDEGERTYLSPSVVQARRCDHVQSVAPLPFLKESLSAEIQFEFNLSDCSPVVHSTSPTQDQGNVPVSSDIIVTFDKDMNRTSVQDALNISPPLSISQTLWPSDNEVLLDVGTMDYVTQYTVTINGSVAKDNDLRYLDGNSNGRWEGSPIDDFVFRFTTEEKPTVVSNGPTGSGVPLESTIFACFNKPMNKSSVEELLTISPSVSHWFWWNRDNTCMYAKAELRLQTAYTVNISGSSTDTNENSLEDAFEWQFSTQPDSPPPQVVDTYPADGESGVDLVSAVTIDFTEEMDLKSLQTGLMVRNNKSFWDKGEEPGHYSIQDFGEFSFDGGTLTISEPALQYDETYEITLSGNVSAGLTDLAGNPLDGDKDGTSEGSPTDDFVFTFSTVDPIPPTVVFTYPSPGQQDIPLRSVVRAIFDDDMDNQTLNSSTVLLKDHQDVLVDTDIFYYQNNNTLLLVPTNGLDFDTTYLVVISSKVRDTSQNTLDGNGDGTGSGTPIDDFSWNFTSIPDTIPPTLEILYPEDDAVFTIGDLINVSGSASDLNGIDQLELRIQNEAWSDILTSLNDTDSSWFHEWGTEDYEEGQYRIQVRAFDPSGLSTVEEVIIRLRKPIEPFPIWIVILVTVVFLVVVTFGYRYARSKRTEREKIAEQRRAEMEEMMKNLEDEHVALVKRAREIEAKELDLETKERYLRDLDAHYKSLAQSLLEREKIDLSTGEKIVAEEMGENIYDIKRYGKAFTLLSEAEASQAGEMTKRLPESGKKALLLVYFNSLESYLREKLKGMIPKGATILLGEKGHINTRSEGWEEKWSTLSLGTLSHAIDHNKHFFVEDEDLWEETKPLMRETVDIRNLTAHPSEENPEVSDVRTKVYSAIQSLSEILKKPRAMIK